MVQLFGGGGGEKFKNLKRIYNKGIHVGNPYGGK